MPESKKSNVVIMDTTKDGVKKYIDKAAEDLKALPTSQAAWKFGTFRYIADLFGIEDKDERRAAWKVMQATPGWFLTNVSAGSKALKYPTSEQDMSEYEGDV